MPPADHPAHALDDQIERALERIFPPDPDLDDEWIEQALDDEIETDDDLHGIGDPGEDDDWYDDDPFGLWAWARDLDEANRIVYGVMHREAVFLSEGFALAVVECIPEIEGRDLDWLDVVPWVEPLQAQWLPADVVQRYGSFAASALDGSTVCFSADDMEAIAATLTARGIACRRDDALVGRATGRSG